MDRRRRMLEFVMVTLLRYCLPSLICYFKKMGGRLVLCIIVWLIDRHRSHVCVFVFFLYSICVFLIFLFLEVLIFDPQTLFSCVNCSKCVCVTILIIIITNPILWFNFKNNFNHCFHFVLWGRFFYYVFNLIIFFGLFLYGKVMANSSKDFGILHMIWIFCKSVVYSPSDQKRIN